MKAKLTFEYDSKYPKGYEVEIDKIEPDDGFGSKVKVRVLNMGKKPLWLDWGWVNKKVLEKEYVWQ